MPANRSYGQENSLEKSTPVATAAGVSRTSSAKALLKALPPPLPLYNFNEEALFSSAINIEFHLPSPNHISAVPLVEEPIGPSVNVNSTRPTENQPFSSRIIFDSLSKETGTPSGEDGINETLVFESRFESGNLRRAIQINQYEYDLLVRPDVNTRANTQWFYFSIANSRAGCQYRLNIVNFTKEDSLYNKGLRVLLYSRKDAEQRGIGWQRAGSDVCWYQNQHRHGTSFYFSLSFSLRPLHDDDIVYLAMAYPYTYTDLSRYLASLEKDSTISKCMRRRTLCKTLAGNTCDLLTITAFTDDLEALKARKGVVLTARVHPGETNSSWMMKGVIDFLTGPSYEAQRLREAFVFKVVPMLNPDGVLCGNYRCSLAGVDLNRQWISPSRDHHPTIFWTKQMIRSLAEDRPIALFCDFHGPFANPSVLLLDRTSETSSCIGTIAFGNSDHQTKWMGWDGCLG